jgi:hypothetical protein
MNFFSHAAIARRFSEGPEFVLGAMLPDFASMLGVRVPEVTHRALADGVRFHHLSDQVFHDLPEFHALYREAHCELSGRGLARGPARAVAHVGIEILLDTSLGQSAAAQEAYRSGLEAGRHPDLVASVAMTANDRERLVDLLETLIRRGVVLDTSSEIIVERIKRTVVRRPRLALGEGDRPRVLDWVETARSRVVGSAPALVDSLHRALKERLSA